MTAERTRLVTTKPKARSRITNGKALLLGVDGRSRSARRFRDLFQSYMAQTGGRHIDLCRQAASLVLQRELLDAATVRGERIDALHFVRIAGAINRTLARIKAASADPETERARREREDREAGLIP